MVRRHRLPAGIALLLVSILTGAAVTAAEKPNILFIFADDQCYDTIHALGNDEIQTPHLDSLVQRGTAFTRAYNMGGWHGAVCVASRTMLATGRFLWKARDVEEQLDAEREAGRLWSESMRRAGYRTYMTGKWHVKTDAAGAFDVAAHVRGGMPAQTPEGYNRPLEGAPDPWSPSDPSFGGFWKEGTHWSEVVADDALQFLEQAAPQELPFFMYVAFNAPHDPRQSPQEFVEMYDPVKLRVPASFLPEYPYKDDIGCGPGLRDEKLAPFPRTEHSVRVHRQEYYAIITHMDQQIGRILKALENSGEADNTWIIFTADHGLAVGHHGLLGKQNMYEHSMRVPFLIVGPGVEKGRKIDTPIYLQDVMPTTLELAGTEPPEHVQFRSLLPLLDGEPAGHYDSIYGAYVDLQRMIIVGDHKLILYPKVAQVRLFNLKDDPNELNDLAHRSELRPVARSLFAELLKSQQQTGDQLDLKAVYPDL